MSYESADANIAEDLSRGLEFIRRVRERYPEFRSQLPEDLLPLGVERGSEPHLRFLTLIASIDYMKNADGLWAGGRRAFAKERWLFEPTEVARRSLEEVAGTLLRFGMTRMTAKDAETWRQICETLTRLYQGRVTDLLVAAGYDASRLYNLIRNLGDLVPYLRGPKILPFWIRILNEEADVRFTGMESLPLPVDINVVKATCMIGLLRGQIKGGMELLERLKHQCHTSWQKACRESSFALIRLDEPLWLLGRENPILTRMASDMLIDGYQYRIQIGYDAVSIDT